MVVRTAIAFLLLLALVTCTAHAQQGFDLPSSVGDASARSAAYNVWFSGPGAYKAGTSVYSQPFEPSYSSYSPSNWVQEAAQENSSQAGSEGGGEAGGSAAGAGAAVNPGVPLAQFQFQNSFLPESYGGSGYSNQFVVQPVIPITLKPGGFFEYHIVRPTLSILSPVPDPDGPVGDTSGIGDIVALDLYFRKPAEGLVWGIGPIYNFPTSTNRQTGLGEWQIGPAVAYIDSRKKGWVTGFLAQAPFSLESDAYSVTVQPILTKLLKDEWYVGLGDVPLIVAGNNNAYNIPLSVRIGRVIKAGKQPINISIQPQYTPAGFHSGPTAEYGVKLSASFLLPGAEFGYSKDKAAKRCSRGCLGCRHCR